MFFYGCFFEKMVVCGGYIIHLDYRAGVEGGWK
jgi:hypothetical protein